MHDSSLDQEACERYGEADTDKLRKEAGHLMTATMTRSGSIRLMKELALKWNIPQDSIYPLTGDTYPY